MATLKVSFNNTQAPFFKSVKAKVDNYFKSENIEPSGSSRLLLKGLIQVATAVGLYVVLVFFTPSPFVSVLLCMLFGINLSIIGFNIMHEGGHQSFSKYTWLNKLSAYSLNALGANTYFWKIKHNVNHHTFTNIEGMDSDIDAKPFMRLHQDQPLYWFHKFQHVYWFFLYGISYIAWVFYEDFSKYFSGRIAANSEPKPLPFKEHVIFWITKILYVVVYIALPVIMVGWLPALIGYLIVTFVTGLFISVVFQLAHMVEDTAFPLVADDRKIEQEWAVHQINTTANFATQDKVVSWLLGGLNFQVEHHLFPRVSHVHYPRISAFVKETCKEFNIDYIEYPSLGEAFFSHLYHIRRLGVS